MENKERQKTLGDLQKEHEEDLKKEREKLIKNPTSGKKIFDFLQSIIKFWEK